MIKCMISQYIIARKEWIFESFALENFSEITDFNYL